MAEIIKKREKRFITDIGKESDEMIMKLQTITGNKKITKKELIYRSLEYCYINKLNLKETPEKPISRKDLNRMEKNIVDKMAFFTKDVDAMINIFKKFIE